MKFQEEWESLVKYQAGIMTREFISSSVLRPFIFFITRLSIRQQKILARELKCMQTCFGILLESINSTGMLITFKLNSISHCFYEMCCCVLDVGPPFLFSLARLIDSLY